MLADIFKKRLLEKYRQLRANGKLFSREKLAQYYSIFRSRFGPERLKSVDGLELLELMHETGNRDSLPYWLEFKNDDEFPSVRFGRIAGRGALKFGIFRRKETGDWQAAGKANQPRDISVEEAVAIARKHREQLLRSLELLEKMPRNGSDSDYDTLQQRMDELAPDVSDLAWGHKYFSLLYPDKLDDFHSPRWQRFHLLKLLQQLPQGDGRYILAGRFLAIAKAVDLPLATLGFVLNALHGRRYRYWRIGTRGGSMSFSPWQMMQDRNCIAIGWHNLGDLSWVEPKKASRERLKALLEEKYPSKQSVIGDDCSQIIDFVAGISKGDVVLTASGSTILGVGRVVGDYSYQRRFEFPHQRPVEWLNLDEWKMPVHEGIRTKVRQIRRYDENILETERRVRDGLSAPAKPTTWKGNVRLAGIPGRIQSVLERKNQVILYGPPGTGKTYWAETTACDLASYWAFGKPFEQLATDQRDAVLGSDKGGGLVRLCCFHSAFAYQDFVEGYRRETVSGQITLSLRGGVFKQLCQDAETEPDRRFFLVVDEINQVDIRRVFGELLTVLEKDKRCKPVVLPTSRETLSVPKNVFLIGTMNTADRSGALLDTVVRRRFGFIQLMPDSSVLRGLIAGIPLGPWFDALNRRIAAHIGGGAHNHQIGHAFLLQDGRPVKDLTAFKQALRDDIIPLLEEYCYQNFRALQHVLGSGLLDNEQQQVRYELFDEGQEDELIQALLEPCPEISTSFEALTSEEDAGEDAVEEDESPDNEP